MTAAITSALTSGFTSKQIIDFLVKKFPQHAPKINSAVAMGFTPQQIIKYLTEGKKGLSHEQLEQNEVPMTEHEKTLKSEQERKSSINQNIVKGAALAGTAALGAVSAPIIARAAQNIPQIANIPMVQQGLSAIGLGGQTQPQQPPTFSGQPIQQPQGQTAQAQPQAQSTQQQQPPVATPPAQIGADALLKYNFIPQIDSLISSGNDPVAIEAYYQKFKPKEMKQFEKETKIPFRQAVEEYVSTQPKSKIEAPSPQIEEEKPKSLVEKIKTLQPGSSVAFPDGKIGDIKSIKNGIARVMIDGKERLRKETDLISSPIPHKDLADLHNDLIGGIEKETGQEVSKMTSWAGYDPKTNELAFVPHTGALYIYDNISPEDVKELTSILAVRKTSGQNFMGAWTKDTKSPIGAQMSALLKKLQKERGGKGNEYKGKFEKIYDALEPAKIASKEKLKESQQKHRQEKQASITPKKKKKNEEKA